MAVIGFASFTIGIVKLFANPSLAMFLTIPSYGYIAYPIQAVVDINPDTLNPKSEGKWITAYIELPTGHNVSEIDVSSILFNGSIPVDVEASTTIGACMHVFMVYVDFMSGRPLEIAQFF